MAEQKKEVDELLDRLLEGKTASEVVGGGGLLEVLTKRLLERALEGELTDHVGYEKHASEGRNGDNSRNGRTRKRIKTATGEVELEIPRDRDGSFEPVLVPKGRRRLPGFDEKVIALVRPGDDDARHPGAPLYPIVYLDAIHLKLRNSGHVQTQAVYLALALTLEGEKELLGLWVGEAEGAKFWLSVLSELKNRGAFPTPDSVRKVLYLAIMKASERWTRPVQDWPAALNHLALVFPGTSACLMKRPVTQKICSASNIRGRMSAWSSGFGRLPPGSQIHRNTPRAEIPRP